jgi:hypothetical protein
MPASLVSSTVKAAIQYGAGQATVPASVVALTKGVLKAMFMNRVRTFAGMFLMAGTLVLGGGLVYRNAAAGQPEVQSENTGVRVSATASTAAKETKDRLQIVADGKQVRVRLVRGDEEFQAVAKSMSYEEDSRRLVLEGDVRVWKRRQGKQPEELQGRRMIIDRKTGTVRVEGPGRIGLAVPMLGPVPVALDFGFPVIEKQQVFSFFLGFTR